MRDSVLGVDGCKAGWIAARVDLRCSECMFSIHSTFASLLADHRAAASVAVDIPIGLTESFVPRACDREARVRLGPRRSSIFSAPDRRLLALATYHDCADFSRSHCGRGITKQSFHIFGKIAEVDDIMTPQLQRRVFEVHPELSFWAAAGERHLAHPKRNPFGYEERRIILQTVFPSIAVPARTEAARGLRGAQPDDVLDAMIAAWTALRQARGECEHVPAIPERDPRRLRMEIAY